MAKVIVAIEVKDFQGKPEDKAALEKHIAEHHDQWFPIPGEPNTICVDEAYMRSDPTDDSFYAFEFRGVED